MVHSNTLQISCQVAVTNMSDFNQHQAWEKATERQENTVQKRRVLHKETETRQHQSRGFDGKTYEVFLFYESQKKNLMFLFPEEEKKRKICAVPGGKTVSPCSASTTPFTHSFQHQPQKFNDQDFWDFPDRIMRVTTISAETWRILGLTHF